MTAPIVFKRCTVHKASKYCSSFWEMVLRDVKFCELRTEIVTNHIICSASVRFVFSNWRYFEALWARGDTFWELIRDRRGGRGYPHVSGKERVPCLCRTPCMKAVTAISWAGVASLLHRRQLCSSTHLVLHMKDHEGPWRSTSWTMMDHASVRLKHSFSSSRCPGSFGPTDPFSFAMVTGELLCTGSRVPFLVSLLDDNASPQCWSFGSVKPSCFPDHVCYRNLMKIIEHLFHRRHGFVTVSIWGLHNYQP